MGDVSGKSLLDLLWAQLDMFVASYQEVAQDYGPTDSVVSEERGKCHGAACQLAFVLNPYAPDVAAVKAEALERWENAHDVPDEPTDPRAARMARRRARQARRAARNS